MPWSLPHPPYPGPDVNDWGFRSGVDLYIVPETGSQFGACSIILEWDNTQYSFGSAVNGNIFGGGLFTTNITTSGTMTRLTIDASLLGGANVNTALGQYIAKVSLNLLKVGYSPVNFYSMDIRYYDGLGGQSSIYTASQKAEVKSYLGDVASSSSEATGDGKLDLSDVTLWTASYWSGVTGYSWRYD